MDDLLENGDREVTAASAARRPSEEMSRPRDLHELARNHEAAVRRFVESRLGKGADADDITQQTLLQSALKLDSFRGGDFRSWLFAIARRLILDLYRDRKRFLSIEEECVQDSEAALRTSATAVQSDCEARERIRCCLDCIGTLMCQEEQLAVLISDVHGFTDKESAARLRMSVPAFKFMLHKARMRLHAAAEDEQPGNECSLVSKTGVESACPGCAHDSGETRCVGGHAESRRSGLDDAALETLRRELMDALETGIGHQSSRVRRVMRPLVAAFDPESCVLLAQILRPPINDHFFIRFFLPPSRVFPDALPLSFRRAHPSSSK